MDQPYPRRTANTSGKARPPPGTGKGAGKGAGSAPRGRQSRTWARRQALPGQADAKAECQLRAAWQWSRCPGTTGTVSMGVTVTGTEVAPLQRALSKNLLAPGAARGVREQCRSLRWLPLRLPLLSVCCLQPRVLADVLRDNHTALSAQEIKVSPSPRGCPKHRRRAICKPVFHPGRALFAQMDAPEGTEGTAGPATGGSTWKHAPDGRQVAPGSPDERARTWARLYNRLAGFDAQLYPPSDDLGENNHLHKPMKGREPWGSLTH